MISETNGRTALNLLLDTHVWVWAYTRDPKLGPQTQKLLVDEVNVRFVSSISTLEMSRLVMLNQFPLQCPLSKWIQESVRDLWLTLLDMDHTTALDAYALPGQFHPDPADRILVSTARNHSLVLLTADEKILKYPHVQTVDART